MQDVYTVKFFDGDYKARQEAANAWGADCYLELHFNSKAYDDPLTQKDNPILTVVAHNASKTSITWAKELSRGFYDLLKKELEIGPPIFQGPTLGVLQRAKFERGDFNLRFTKMPAILPEPLFISDVVLAKLAMEWSFQQKLAGVIVYSIVERFAVPTSRPLKVALSIGHMGKTSQKYDRGAPITNKVLNPNKWAEAHLSQMVLDFVATKLRVIKRVGDNDVKQGGTVIWPDESPSPNNFACPNCDHLLQVLKVNT